MKNYIKMTEDNGGVHVNSGIPNHAFYLAATMLGGKAWETAGRIWYDALTRRLRSRAVFQTCAEATASSAAELFGSTSAPHHAVIEAWKRVGIEVKTAAPRLPIKATPAF